MSRAVRPGRHWFRGAWALWTLCAWGCGSRPQGFEQYTPKPDVARAAVVGMLDLWREGRPVETPIATRPAAHVVDKHRHAGQRLARYEILGEVSVENARGFAVRVHLENPEEATVSRFLVIGLDPLWVFRQEDYDMIAHWMHPMEPAGSP